MLTIALSRNRISIGNKIEELDQNKGVQKTLDFSSQNMVLMSIIVLSRNGISLKINIQGFDQTNQFSKIRGVAD